MKYAHFADLHLGSWREEKMRHLSTTAFLQAVDYCIQIKVDFILFAGDLFNTSLPSLDTLKIVTQKLKELQEKDIPLYVIAGSHDFSPSGKTMIDVLEKAGLLINVCKGKIDEETRELHLHFTIDKNTGVKITGILGRRGLLDRTYYETIAREELEKEEGYKIFMFHTTVSELLPAHLTMIESQPISHFPKNFSYYAGGHIHHPTKKEIEGYGTVTYTGALFPNNFSEVEKYGTGGFFLISYENKEQTVEWKPLKVIEHCGLQLNCSGKTPHEVFLEILSFFEQKNVQGALLTINLQGVLQQGKVTDIDFTTIFEKLHEKGAQIILKNTARLLTQDFEEIKMADLSSENIEEEIIKEHLQQMSLFEKDTEFNLIKQLLETLNTQKKEGETVTDFQTRIEEDFREILKIEKR